MDKIFTFLLIISVVWVGSHLYADLSRYTKEHKVFEPGFDNFYWSIHGLIDRHFLNKIFGNTRIIIS